MAANGAQYGIATMHFYWIGAVPAMIFLGIVMMPFYYASKVRSVPEYLRRRFDPKAHIFNALTFAVATVLISGVNLFALGLVISLMLGWSITTAIIVAAAVVLTYIVLGGLSSAIYNEVLQFFVIIAALLPLTIVGLIDVGGSAASATGSRVRPRRGRAARVAGAGGRRQPTRSARTGSRSSSASASSCRSATGRRTSPRCSARCRPEPLRRPAHAADRRVPEDLHPRRSS